MLDRQRDLIVCAIHNGQGGLAKFLTTELCRVIRELAAIENGSGV